MVLKKFFEKGWGFQLKIPLNSVTHLNFFRILRKETFPLSFSEEFCYMRQMLALRNHELCVTSKQVAFATLFCLVILYDCSEWKSHNCLKPANSVVGIGGLLGLLFIRIQ